MSFSFALFILVCRCIAKWNLAVRGLLQAGKAIARQNDYGSELEARVSTNIKEKVEAFERAVRTCLSIDTRGIATNVVTVGKTLDIVDGKIDSTVGELRKTVAALITIEYSFRDMKQGNSPFIPPTKTNPLLIQPSRLDRVDGKRPQRQRSLGSQPRKHPPDDPSPTHSTPHGRNRPQGHIT